MKIDPYVLEAIKGMDLPKLMQGYGLQLKPVGKNAYQTRCPFHEDKTPSLSVGYRNNKWIWNCFGPGCRAHGNYLDFRMMYEKISFTDAYQKSADELKMAPAAPAAANGHAPAPAAAPTGIPRQEALARAVEVYHEAFMEDRRGVEYMAQRGIKDGDLLKRHKVGFVNGRLRRMLPDDSDHETVRALREAGILNEKGTERFFNCVVFPIYDGNGAVVGLYGRNTRRGAAGVSHLYLPGPHRGVWNAAAIKAHGDIVLTESIIDALSLCSVGVANAVPLYGTNGLTEEHLRLFREHRTRRVFMCLDNDAPGERARIIVEEKLTPLGIEVLSFDLPKTFKDPNDALVKGFPGEELLVLARCNSVLATARKLAETGKAESAAASTPEPARSAGDVRPPAAPAPELSVERREDGIHFAFSGRAYRVVGLPGKRREHMRVSLKVESAGAVHVDHIDLYSAKSRAAFVACCRRIFDAQEGELHGELNRMIPELERMQGAAEDAPAGPPPMTEEARAEALAALQSPTLYADILRDMETVGYVGEEHNKAIGYLVGVSRKLDDPLSCSIISQSAAGKSVLADTVEKLTPPEDVVSLSRATPQAFFYIAKGGIKHKLIVMEERVGAEQADYAIRTLQSKKKLSQVVTMKDETTGEMKSKFFEVEGPVAYIESTTQPRIHEENATRCFLIFLDESPEQTRRIHERQRMSKTLDGLRRKGGQDGILRRHHNMQRLLKNVPVVIPFADRLDFPTTWLRTRRDNLRFLNLIVAVTFLHQYQREEKRTEEGVPYIEATFSDYEIAYALAKAVMGESFTDLKKPQRELLRAVEAMHPAEGAGGGVTRRQIRERTGLGDTRLRDLLAELVSLEYLRDAAGGGQGKTARYVLAERRDDVERSLPGLTTPEELRQKLQ